MLCAEPCDGIVQAEMLAVSVTGELPRQRPLDRIVAVLL